MKTIHITVPKDCMGRIDRILIDLINIQDGIQLSRSQLKRRIENGLVLLNGIPASKSGSIVSPGDECTILEWKEEQDALLQPYDLRLPILFEDESIAIIDKPPQLTVHPGAGTGHQTLMNALIGMGVINPQQFPGNPRPGIVHRLDRDTSGLLIVAKTLQAQAALSYQFQERALIKRYTSLVVRNMKGGQPFDREDSGSIDSPIGRDSRHRTKMCIREDGRAARTDWVVQERLPHAYLLLLTIHSGRTHQIRVHLDSVNSGVLGDQLYGKFDTLSPAAGQTVDTLGRQALHACELHFKHPQSGETLSYVSELPHDIEEALKRFRQLN